MCPLALWPPFRLQGLETTSRHLFLLVFVSPRFFNSKSIPYRRGSASVFESAKRLAGQSAMLSPRSTSTFLSRFVSSPHRAEMLCVRICQYRTNKLEINITLSTVIS